MDNAAQLIAAGRARLQESLDKGGGIAGISVVPVGIDAGGVDVAWGGPKEPAGPAHR